VNPSNSIKYEVVEYTRGVVLDIAGKAYPHFLCVDTPREGVRPDIRVETPSDLSLVIEDGSVDAVYCSQYAEAIKSLADWWRCVKVGGHLVLNLQDDPKQIIDAMRDVVGGWDLIVREDDKQLLVFRKIEGQSNVNSWMVKALKGKQKTACVVRYGGFGDMIQAANVLPALKRQGYRVTVMTTPKGKEVIENDPNIDDWFIQDHDQVPNHELSEFWKVVSQRFDKFVNLCESVEGTLIAMPGRANHGWPHEVRHAMLDENYLEFSSMLAGVPYASESKFYPTEAETRAARARLGPGLNVMWALAGSSCHKFYPGQDVVIARILLENQDCRIFLVGDAACVILEAGWEKESRVVCLSGEIGIRDTLALAKEVDVVLGCETGVLNAVAFEDNRKVVLLSHSSHENLTKHWENTIALAPNGLDCYPCHRLHYTREFCKEDKETGAAMCQRLIDPADVYRAVIWKEQAAA